jgi:branched-chain amino acid transport system permease protein
VTTRDVIATAGPVRARGRPSPAVLRLFGFLLAALVLVLPLMSGRYGLALATEILIFAILAMSLDLLLGYTGMPSLGHAAFFGLGTHFVVLLGVHYDINAWIGLALGVLAAAAYAAIVGFLSVRTAGITFLMLTMAFSQLLYSVSLRWRAMTGGTDGISGLARPTLAGQSLDGAVPMYLVVLLAFVLSYLFLYRLIHSPFGHAFVGIRENEQRMRAIGYPVERYKQLSFVISGALGGLAGGLYGIFNGFVSADVLHWTLSGDILIMVIVGGAGTLIGPAIGAAVLLLAKYLISSYVESWMLVVGLIFIACVIALRGGIYGTLANRFRQQSGVRGVEAGS